jgi:hypothetical protein
VPGADSIDWRAFGRAILAPPLPRLDEALVVARELAREQLRASRRDGRRRLTAAETAAALAAPRFLAEAWETMTLRLGGDAIFERSERGGVLFAPFLPLREWAVPRPRPECLSGVPLDLETMVALLAAEPGHVLAAEETAMEIGARLEPWRGRPVRSVVWGFVGELWMGRQLESAFYRPSSSIRGVEPEARVSDRAIYRALGVPYGEEVFSVARPAFGGPGFRARQAAAADAQTWSWWRWADRIDVERRVSVQNVAAGIAAIRSGTPVYDATLALWGLGYVPVDVLGDAFYIGLSLPTSVGAVAATSLKAVASEAARRYGDEL